MKKLFQYILGIFVLCNVSYAGTITHTDYTAGNVITAAGQNSNENTIFNEFNGSINSSNIAALGVATSNLAANSVTSAKLDLSIQTSTIAATTALTVNSQNVCQAGGVNCPAGTPVQVHGVTTSSTTSSSFIITGASVTITPSTASKRIIIRGYAPCQVDSSGTTLRLNLNRNGTPITTNGLAELTTSAVATASATLAWYYIDSPSTTSPITYIVTFASSNGSTNVRFGTANSDWNIVVQETN